MIMKHIKQILMEYWSSKTYTKVNDKPNDIDNEAIDIMKNDISNQKHLQ